MRLSESLCFLCVFPKEEHSAQCFSTRDDVVKHEDNRNVTRLITVGRSLQPRPAEMLNMVCMYVCVCVCVREREVVDPF